VNVVKLMLDNGAKNYGETMKSAASGGHIDLVQLMLELNETGNGRAVPLTKGRFIMYHPISRSDYNWAMALAAEGGHIDLVQLMLDSGADDYNIGLHSAGRGGHIDIVKLMMKRGADEYNKQMALAAWAGHIDIVRLMLEAGANNLGEGLQKAAFGGHLDVIRLFLGHSQSGNIDADSYRVAKYYATVNQRSDILELIDSAESTENLCQGETDR
jgi:hypothetical protein